MKCPRCNTEADCPECPKCEATMIDGVMPVDLAKEKPSKKKGSKKEE